MIDSLENSLDLEEEDSWEDWDEEQSIIVGRIRDSLYEEEE